MLNIMLLEERIVLDGAVVDTVIDQIADQSDAGQAQQDGQDALHQKDAAA